MVTTVDRIAKKIGTRAKRVHDYLMQHPGKQQFSDIADALQMPADAVVRAVDQLAGEGRNIAVSVAGVEVLHDLPTVKHETIDVASMKGKRQIYGVTADNHLCFPAVTPIQTDHGVKKIASIKVGDMVLTHRNHHRRVTEVIKSKCDGSFVRLWFRGKSDGGSNLFASIFCTPNHPLLVNRDGKDCWVPAGQIVVGEPVRVLGKKCAHCDNLIPPWLSVCRSHDFYCKPYSQCKEQQRKKALQTSNQNRHAVRDVAPVMEKWENQGWRVIPLDSVRPDFIAIRDGKVVAVEVEAPTRGRPHPFTDKYGIRDMAKRFDDVVWEVKDPRTRKKNLLYDYMPANSDGFIGAFVMNVTKESRKRSQQRTVYNLKVEEDESYVAKNVAAHNCSKYSRLDVLNALFDTWESQGVTTVLQCGNIIDGECRFNKHDLEVVGMDKQVDYLIENWPRRKGIVTEFVTGDDHEGWYVQREGVDIGKHIELRAQAAGRNDLVYVGHMERQVEFNAGPNKSVLSMLHAGGGTAYAISYTSQKQVESYQPGEKPTILLAGHFHKFDWSYPRAVHAIQPGCTMDQSPWMRKRRIEAMVGGVTLEFDIDKRALINNVRVTWMPFYDRSFYKGNVWKYRWK